MTQDRVAANKVVSVIYSIKDEQGETIEHTDLPVSYIHGGRSDMFEKIERELEGKTVDDRVQVTLGPDEAFGDHNPGLTFTDDIENVPEALRFVGAELEAQNAEGETLKFIVTGIKDSKLTVDANHPMAGKTVTFHVKVADVRDATSTELASGQPEELGLPIH